MKKNHGNLLQNRYKNFPADFSKEWSCGPPLQKFTPSTELMNSDLPLEFKFSFFFSSAE